MFWLLVLVSEGIINQDRLEVSVLKFITGSFYYRRYRKQQHTVASDASFVSFVSCNISGFQ